MQLLKIAWVALHHSGVLRAIGRCFSMESNPLNVWHFPPAFQLLTPMLLKALVSLVLDPF